jgi:hypothetical protein
VCAWNVPDDGLQEATLNFSEGGLMAAVKKKKPKQAPEMSLVEMSARADERYDYAKAIKELQDEPTVVAINRMVAQMARMTPVIVEEDAKKRELKKSIQYKNQTYIAVRLLVACAKWDIRIANFKLPKKRCADCGKKVK